VKVDANLEILDVAKVADYVFIYRILPLAASLARQASNAGSI
jgi:hypothetical protein